MANLVAGILNIEDSDRTFVNTVGQAVVYEAVQQVFGAWNANLLDMMAAFVEKTTENHRERYYSLAGGRLQEQGGYAQAGTTRASGYWDVGYPLRQYGTAWGYTEVDVAYLTVGQLDRHITNITAQGINTLRFQILKTIFYSTQIASYDDGINDAYNIDPLANGDTAVYPPVSGSEDGATENHYLESGYLATAISDTNNPVVTIVDDLAHHFGGVAEELEIVTFIHKDEQADVEALSDYVDIADMHITKGDDQDKISGGVPSVPGTVIGRTDSSWISRWDWMPTGYMIGLCLNEDAPLRMRVDPSATGLPQGLNLVGFTDSQFPLHGSQYRHRFGLGVSNRLNGVVMELANGGTYTIPTAYQ